MNLGMNSAIQGLLTAQRALDVASHNIANANTPGYSRQRADLTTTQPMGAGGLHMRYGGVGQVGTGVQVSEIKRITDQFIGRQIRAESAPLGQANIASDTLKQVEDIFDEPSDRSLGTMMTNFWNGWQDLTTHPEDSALRTNLRDISVNLSAVFNDVHTKLTNLRQDVNDRVASTVDDINSLTSRIADMNRQVSAGLATGQNPNDLQDSRDQLIEQLSQKLNIHVQENPTTGALNVFMDGQPLVVENDSFNLVAAPTLTNGFFQVNYGPIPGQAANITGGELKGLLDARNVTLSDTQPGGLLNELNTMAQSLMTSVNTVHKGGFGLDGVTMQDFFNGTDASDIQVNPALLQVPDGIRLIAAASNDPGSLSGGPADNGNALKIAQLRTNPQALLGNVNFDDYYKNLLTNVGTQGQQANRKVDTQTQLLSTVKQRRDEVSGVSTDEEMADVLKYQKAYAASARVMSTIDQMLDILVNLGK